MPTSPPDLARARDEVKKPGRSEGFAKLQPALGLGRCRGSAPFAESTGASVGEAVGSPEIVSLERRFRTAAPLRSLQAASFGKGSEPRHQVLRAVSILVWTAAFGAKADIPPASRACRGVAF